MKLPLLLLAGLIALPAAAQSGARTDTIRVDSVTRAGAVALTDLLSTRSPSAVVRGSSGAAWAGARVYLRGISSVLHAPSPLVVVNGVRIAGGAASVIDVGGQAASLLDDLDPEEIEEMVVLPGAAAAARYGPEGANGVIEVRTRRGSSTTGLRVRGFVEAGARSDTEEGPLLWRRIGRLGGTRIPNCPRRLESQCTPLPDSMQSVIGVPRAEPSLHRAAHVAAETGGDWGAVRASADAGRSEGLQADEQLDRTRFSLSADLRPRPGLELQAGALHGRRDAVMGYADGLFEGYRYQSWLERALELPAAQVPPVRHRGTRTIGWAHAAWQAMPWLQVVARAGHDEALVDEARTIPGSPTIHTTADAGWLTHTAAAAATAAYSPRPGMDLRTTLEVERWTGRFAIAEKDSLGSQVQEERSSRRQRTLGVGLTQQVALGGITGLATLRRDDPGSGGEAWSGSVGLAASPLELAPGQPLRVRASYGWIRRPLPPLALCEVLCLETAPGHRVREAEVGVSGGAARGQLGLSLTGYRREADEPMSLADDAARLVVLNSGVEAVLTFRPEGGRWSAEMIAWTNRNRVTDALDATRFPLSGGSRGQSVQVGHPVGAYFGRQILSFQDADGNGLIALGEVELSEVRYLGSPLPDHGVVLGGQLRLTRGIRLGARVEHQGGNQLLNENRMEACRLSLCRAQVDPSATLADQASAVANTRALGSFIEDGSFTRLRELSATIAAPRGLVRAAGASGADLVIAGRNLITLSSAEGMDPEVAFAGATGPLLTGDSHTQPIPRVWTVRLEVRY